ncbi:DUF6090 family protein [Hanstruepera ponticola]|uniref:DUF6090 family protein n=1 Tax=Hanstruepera ponticola TaxID=2042995 RepID=UPI00177BDDE1|nr:DUF6090 family protein [Hanstruepera ponticola]
MENKTSKYFKYAIGEIVLVVIGILIALQINNWNENRKTRAVEIKLVNRLIADVKADSIFYNSRLELFSKQINVYNNIYKMCSSAENLPKDSLILEDFETPFVKAANYSDVINNSQDIMEQISDDSIKQALRNYNKSFVFISTAIEITNETVRKFDNIFRIEHDKISQFNKPMSLLDYKVYCETENLEGYLTILMGSNQNCYSQTERFLKDNDQLRLKLNNYLNKL